MLSDETEIRRERLDLIGDNLLAMSGIGGPAAA